MSYDLYLKPRTGSLGREDFLGYFSDRQFYTINNDQAWYENEDTGVYFSFEFEENEGEDGEVYPFAFNMNLFRPTFFVKEAEPEVTAFVREFDLVVDDPQVSGMGTGEYEPAAFAAAWLKSNEKATGVAINDQDEPDDDGPEYYCLPTARLEKIWEWNYGNEKLQDELGEEIFVPMIMTLLVEGSLQTACVWPDAISSVIPPVDMFVIGREELAPRKWLRKTEDFAIAKWNAVEPLLKANATEMIGDAYKLWYEQPPADLEQFVRSLTPIELDTMEKVSFDQILNTELIEKVRE